MNNATIPPARRNGGLGIILIHGLGHGSWCWSRLEPKLAAPVLAVDLPGRAGRPEVTGGDFTAQYIEALRQDVESAAFGQVILVGHSMGGLWLPGLCRVLGARVAHLVFVSAAVLLPGQDAWSVHPPWFSAVARRLSKRSGPIAISPGNAKWMFCNDMDPQQTHWLCERLCPERVEPVFERARLTVLDVPAVPATYVKLTRDKAFMRSRQAVMAARLGERGSVVEIDAGHDVMLSRPDSLATVINAIVERCALRQEPSLA